MAERKRSLLEKFISGLAAASADEEEPKRRSRVVPAGTYKTRGTKPRSEMLGTGQAARAGRALAGRGRQIDAQERGIIGR